MGILIGVLGGTSPGGLLGIPIGDGKGCNTGSLGVGFSMGTLLGS